MLDDRIDLFSDVKDGCFYFLTTGVQMDFFVIFLLFSSNNFTILLFTTFTILVTSYSFYFELISCFLALFTMMTKYSLKNISSPDTTLLDAHYRSSQFFIFHIIGSYSKLVCRLFATW